MRSSISKPITSEISVRPVRTPLPIGMRSPVLHRTQCIKINQSFGIFRILYKLTELVFQIIVLHGHDNSPFLPLVKNYTYFLAVVNAFLSKYINFYKGKGWFSLIFESKDKVYA